MQHAAGTATHGECAVTFRGFEHRQEFFAEQGLGDGDDSQRFECDGAESGALVADHGTQQGGQLHAMAVGDGVERGGDDYVAASLPMLVWKLGCEIDQPGGMGL